MTLVHDADEAEYREAFEALLDDTTPDPRCGSRAAVASGQRNLPERFWVARPELAHIRQAAHSRARSADAVLSTVLARISSQVPPSYALPAIAGAASPLSLFVALLGPSGAGKSSAKTVGAELLPYDGDLVADDLPLGSGE